MTTPQILTPDERDALYRSLIVRLTGINDVYIAIEAEDWDLAERLSREFSDLLRLAQDLGLGRGEPRGDTDRPARGASGCAIAAAGKGGDD
ncbi:MAG: hypothetical protein QOF06_112 [Solirubrobacterales bacterium]|jgi:hypothetical protein|nr:hypothetical protein [Solirubrobacterales bacterium]